MIKPAAIKFAPCTGFGDLGRSASLFDDNGNCICVGCGETDDEAVVEALMESRVTFDEACDARSAVMAGARITYDQCQPN